MAWCSCDPALEMTGTQRQCAAIICTPGGALPLGVRVE
jgi:hypothetical protein